MKKLLGVLMTMILVASLLQGCSTNNESGKSNGQSSEKKVVWRFVHEEVEGGVQDSYARKFEELVEKQFEGKVDIEVYPVGQLGDGTGQIELLQNGGVEFAINNPGSVATIIPETQVMSLNFLFSKDSRVNQKVLIQGKSIQELNKLYLEKNMKALDWFNLGFMNWTSNKPINNVSDFKGFKMRTMASPLIMANYEALKANPTPVPFMEVYSSLQLKMIDGQEQPITAIEEMKFYEVQKNLTLSQHAILPSTLCANPQFWDSLSKEERQKIESIIPELQEYIFEQQAKLTEKALNKIKEASDIEFTKLTPESRAEFKEASLPVRDEFIKMTGEKGKKIMELLIEDVAEYGK